MTEKTYGPSKADIELAADKIDHYPAPWGPNAKGWARVMLIAVCRPERGLDRMVRLRDVVELLRLGGDPHPADLVERTFREGFWPERQAESSTTEE